MFTMEEQTFYLTEYFAKIGNVLPSNKNVDVFVSKLLAATKLNLNDLDHRFTGVPLQTMLIAEVFADDFLKYLDEGVFKNDYFDLIYLYEQFINKKITIACAKVENIPEYMIDLFIECRSFYGLRHLFDREDLQELQIDEELNVINKRLPHALQLIQKDGITVIDSDSNVTFVHRTYAEYLAANWLSDNINSAHKEVVEKLVKKTFHHNFVVVRNIFDRILAKHCPLHSAIINRQMHKVKTLITLDENAFAVKDRGGRTILHLMSAWGLHHRDDHNTYFNSPEDGTIITILSEAPKNKLKQVADELLHYTPLEYAILSRSLRIADNLALGMKHPICKINITKKETDCILEYARKYYSVWLYIIILKCFIRTASNEHEINGDLQKIIRKGDLDRVRCLISDQTVDVPDINDACNLLQTAVKGGHKDIAHLLLAMKTNVNKTDRNGRTALHWASYLGHLEIISILLSNGANCSATDCYDLTPSHYALLSSSANQPDIVSLLLTKETMAITNWIKTILRMPTQKFNEIGNTNKIQSEKYYMNPMHLAVLLGQYEILKLILCQNLNINVKAWGGKTALMFAAQTNQIDIIQLLLTHGADIYSRDDTDQTALHHAALEGHADAVTILLTNNLDMNAKTIHNETPLHCAVFKNYQDVVSILLANGADIDQTNYKNSTPLHVAAYHDHPDLIPILLTNGAYIDPSDCKNMTPLHLAASRGNPDVVRVLLANGADIHARSSNCNTPLNLAAFEGQKDVVSILLTNGAQIEARDIDYKTPLHVAAFKGRQEVVTILLANNADVEAKTSQNKTPLYCAAENGHEHVVTILLTNGAQVDAKGADYTTPLHLAAEQGHKDLIIVLLDNGADISARNSSYKTPLDLAAKRGHGDVVTILTNACGRDKFS